MEYVSFGRFVTMIHCRGGQGKSRELRSLQKHAQTFCVDVVFFFLKQSVEVVFPKTLCFVNPCGATSESGVGGKNSFELQAMRIMLASCQRLRTAVVQFQKSSFFPDARRFLFLMEEPFFEFEIEDAR